MKKFLIAMFVSFLAAGSWAQAEETMEESAKQVHELFQWVEKIGDPRILSSGNPPEDYGKNYTFA